MANKNRGIKKGGEVEEKEKNKEIKNKKDNIKRKRVEKQQKSN